ncbi:acid sphingomyelinase-like phosphodiesterase 3b [Ptychodera flava]|uniref:acid sphingomyelinase-like phosphodiesterase 3b n=1 Tax=Ptychodera flava TaxID=63121 RepID=UPI003969DA09
MACTRHFYFLVLLSVTVCIAADVGYIWHVTDFHYEVNYTAGDYPESSCRDLQGETPHYWGDYRCDSPWTLINSSVYAMHKIQSNPDFIVWTGDDTPHVPNDNLDTDKVLAYIWNLTALLVEVFPEKTIFPVLGNHDYHPKHQMPPEPNPVYTQVSKWWNDHWLGQYEGVNDTFTQAAYYTVEYKPGHRIVGLNTVYYYTNDKLTAEMEDPGNQFQWLEEILTNAMDTDEKIYIIGHVPPGVFERHAGKSWFYPKFNERYISIIRKYHQVIYGQFFAHQHDDSFRIFYDEQDRAVSSLLLAPAVTPWNTTLSGVGPNNPGIRLLEFDRDTWEILDIKQYYLNLSKTESSSEPEWILEYSAAEEYNIPDVTTESLQKLVDSFGDKESDNFQKYYLYNSVSYDQGKCDDQCKTEQICAITKVDFEDYSTCLAEGAVDGVNPLVASAFFVFNAFLILVHIMI